MNLIKGKEYNLYYIFISLLIIFIFIGSKVFLSKSTFKNEFTVKDNLSIQYNSGLLIGFRTDLNKNTSTYRTIWITPDKNNSLKITKELNYILVPHKDTFWQLEPVHYSFTNTEDSIEYTVSHAVGGSYTPETFEYKFSTYASKLNFVDKNHVSIVTYNKFHTNKESSYIIKDCTLVELEKLTYYKNTEDKITMKDVFNDKSNSIIKNTENQKVSLGESPAKDTINTTNGDSWTIGRMEGKWIPQIAKTFKYSGKNSNYTLYNTSLQLPQSIVSHNELCTDFNYIKRIIPEAKDAISSPNKDILGVFTNNKLTLYPYSNDAIGKAALDINLNEGEIMIMAQWTSGNYIEDWTKTFNETLPLVD